jgi:UDP-2,3-diacylglucosamine hydrolase
MKTELPAFESLKAPARWRVVDFISDLHLHAQDPSTFLAWRQYLEKTPAQAVFILGDWFEVWVGDDVLSTNLPDKHDGLSFDARCARVMHFAAERMNLFVMHGNRDFLIGPALMAACNAQLLADPTVLQLPGQAVLLTHGDALCLSDTAYQQFRAQVRSSAWQVEFLAKPLPERQHIARQMRDASEAQKKSNGTYADVDAAATLSWLQAAGCATMIHGHTHAPATHDLGNGVQRMVLSDWDAAAQPPRAQVLRWSADSAAFERINLLAL